MAATTNTAVEQVVRGSGAPLNGQDLGRAALAVLGGTLLVRSLQQRSLAGVALGIAGGGLLHRAISPRSASPGASGALGAGASLQLQAGAPADATEVERWVTVRASADELYQTWREPANLPQVMGHFAEVTPTDAEHAHWVVRAPLGRTLEWDSRIVEDRPGELVRWESLPGAGMPNEGQVRFRPAQGGRGTEAALRFRFDPPAGVLGDAAMKLSDLVPGTLAGVALRRFKSLVEAGEIPSIERNPSARGSGDAV